MCQKLSGRFLQICLAFSEIRNLSRTSIIRIAIIIFRLNFKAVEIDARLGFILQLFALDNGPVRYVASKCPELILWKGTPTQLENNYLALSKFMEFNRYEMKIILTKCPKIFMQQDTDYIQAKSLYISRTVSHFYGTEFEIWAGFGPVVETVKES